MFQQVKVSSQITDTQINQTNDFNLILCFLVSLRASIWVHSFINTRCDGGLDEVSVDLSQRQTLGAIGFKDYLLLEWKLLNFISNQEPIFHILFLCLETLCVF